MMLRWISELPPAIVLANDMKKPCDVAAILLAVGTHHRRDRTGDFHAELERGLARFRGRHLHVAVLRRRRTLRKGSEALVAEGPQARRQLVGLGDLPPDNRVAVLAGSRARSTSASIVCSKRADALDPEAGSFVCEGSLRDRPATVQVADEVVARDDDIGEEDLRESCRTVDVAQRPDVDTGRLHVDDQQRDALVLRQRGIGPHVAEALLGDHRVAGPDLLAVYDEVVVEYLGACLQTGEVGARVGLAHPDAPDRVATDRGRRELLLFVVAEIEQARRDDRVAGKVAAAQNATTRKCLEEDQRLDGCAVAAAELGRVAGDHPAVVEERGLPVAHPLGYEVGAGVDVVLEVEAAPDLGRRMLVEEAEEFRAERLVFFVPGELHRRPSDLTCTSANVSDQLCSSRCRTASSSSSA